MNKRWLWWLAFVVLSAAAILIAFHCDDVVRTWIAHHQNHGAKLLMRNVSRFGDWPEHVILGVSLLALAYWRHNKKWMRIFAAMLLACALAGVASRAIKISTGRARPSVHSAAAWKGPHIASKYNAFPSGHTAASLAFFTTLFFVSWRIGLGCLPIPLLIAASRMYVGAHYISDVVCGAVLAVLCAWLSARLLFQRGKIRTANVT